MFVLLILDENLLLLYIPCKELAHTPESPEPEHIEEAKHLTFMLIAGEDSVYQLKRKS